MVIRFEKIYNVVYELRVKTTDAIFLENVFNIYVDKQVDT